MTLKSYAISFFQEATEVFSAAKNVTSSMVVPTIFDLSRQLSDITTYTPDGRILKNALLQGFKDRLLSVEKNSFLSQAVILDPRFKQQFFLDSKNGATALSKINEEIFSQHNISTPLQLQPQVPPKGILSRLNILKGAPSSGETVPLRTVFNLYLREATTTIMDDPLKYWEARKLIFPALYDKALNLLVLPASSVASERVASALNNYIGTKKCSIKDGYLSKRIFLAMIPDKYLD